MFFRSISQVELDNAARILIPKTMLLHAKVNREALLIGTGNYIEIWDPHVFKLNQKIDVTEFSNLAEKYLDE
jgi:MraZ protein